MTELILKDEVFAIVGAAMEVHNVLGCGFLEPVYQEALEIELSKRKMPYTPQKKLPIYYKGHRLKRAYVPDYIAFEKIVIEIKAVSTLSSLEESQLLNYLKASNLQVGLLLNFGAESLQWKRMVQFKPEKISEIREISG
ncbi:MAG: GxxExxY protein [Chloroflexi bacterium]|nr:GxxExxY protein [Chloroflexota bacterium]